MTLPSHSKHSLGPKRALRLASEKADAYGGPDESDEKTGAGQLTVEIVDDRAEHGQAGIAAEG